MRWWFLLVLWASASAQAQISPPGLGEAATAGWVAMGARQALDASDRRESMTYIGAGAVSDPGSMDPLQNPAILVVNEELYDHFAPHWTYSLALSYRRQNEYAAGALHASQHEVRLYGRGTYTLQRGRFKLVETLRPELRNFIHGDDLLQLRLRVRTQLAVTLDARKMKRMIGSAEVLASAGRERERWSHFDYRESRFCLYYSLERSSFMINLGYMNDLLGTGAAIADVHYLALDVTWQNPFGVHAKPHT